MAGVESARTVTSFPSIPQFEHQRLERGAAGASAEDGTVSRRTTCMPSVLRDLPTLWLVASPSPRPTHAGDRTVLWDHARDSLRNGACQPTTTPPGGQVVASEGDNACGIAPSTTGANTANGS